MLDGVDTYKERQAGVGFLKLKQIGDFSHATIDLVDVHATIDLVDVLVRKGDAPKRRR